MRKNTSELVPGHIRDGEVAVRAAQEEIAALGLAELLHDSRLDSDESYAELYVEGNPAKELLWKSRELIDMTEGAVRDAVIVELVGAYAYVDEAEAWELVGQIKGRDAKIQALAKYGYASGSSAAIEHAIQMAGRNKDKMLAVALEGHNEELKQVLYKKASGDFSQIPLLLTLAYSGYLPALQDLKRFVLEYRNEKYIPKLKRSAYVDLDWLVYVSELSYTIRTMPEGDSKLEEATETDLEWQRYCEANPHLKTSRIRKINNPTVHKLLDENIVLEEGIGSRSVALNEGKRVSYAYFEKLMRSYRGRITNPEYINKELNNIKFTEPPALSLDSSDTYSYLQKGWHVKFKSDIRYVALAKIASERALGLYQKELEELEEKVEHTKGGIGVQEAA